MTTKTKDDDAGAPADAGADDDAGAGDQEGGDDEGDGDELEATVEKVVRRILGEVLGSDDDDGDSGGAGDVATPRTGADEERRMESVVKRAMDQLRAQESTASRLEKMEKVVERVIKEVAPAKLRRVTRAMWGEPKK